MKWIVKVCRVYEEECEVEADDEKHAEAVSVDAEDWISTETSCETLSILPAPTGSEKPK